MSKSITFNVLIVAIVAPLAMTQMANAQPTPAAQPQAVVQRMPPPPTAEGEKADIPMTLTAGMPTITVTVNGKPLRLGVDTGGGGQMALKPEVVETLGLEKIGETMLGDPSGLNRRTAGIHRVDELKVGGLTFKGARAAVMPMPGDRLAAIDGIIGNPLFRQLLLTMDYGRGRLIAQKGSLPAADGRRIFDAEVNQAGFFTIPLTIGATTQNAVIDTGNVRQALFVPADAVAKLPTRGSPRTGGTAQTISQSVAISVLDLAAPVKLGSTTLPVKEIGYPAIGKGANLGSRGLDGLALTLDWRNKRVRIVPSGGGERG